MFITALVMMGIAGSLPTSSTASVAAPTSFPIQKPFEFPVNGHKGSVAIPYRVGINTPGNTMTFMANVPPATGLSFGSYGTAYILVNFTSGIGTVTTEAGCRRFKTSERSHLLDEIVRTFPFIIPFLRDGITKETFDRLQITTKTDNLVVYRYQESGNYGFDNVTLLFSCTALGGHRLPESLLDLLFSTGVRIELESYLCAAGDRPGECQWGVESVSSEVKLIQRRDIGRFFPESDMASTCRWVPPVAGSTVPNSTTAAPKCRLKYNETALRIQMRTAEKHIMRLTEATPEEMQKIRADIRRLLCQGHDVRFVISSLSGVPQDAINFEETETVQQCSSTCDILGPIFLTLFIVLIAANICYLIFDYYRKPRNPICARPASPDRKSNNYGESDTFLSNGKSEESMT